MRKYLFIATNEGPNWGGSELLWSSAAEKLARRGEEVRVSVRDFCEPRREMERARSAGCRIFYRRLPSFAQRFKRHVLRGPGYVSEHVCSVGKGVDLVVISQGFIADGLPWMEAAGSAGLKYAVIVQSASEVWWPGDEIAKTLAVNYENAVRAYFVSQATLDLCRRQFATPLPCGRVIRNPFNVRYDTRPPWPTDFSDGLSLACVGRIDMGTKGQDVLLHVLSLPHWRKRKIRVSLVGEGPNERVLRSLADNLKLTNVEFAGHQSNIEEVWSRHHALVLPSRMEGMPLVVVEAMLCGRVCIATDVGGNRELIRDGINGFLIKAATVELLDEAMNRAWENRSGLREMGKIAAADVREWVSPDPTEDFVRELQALAANKT